MARAQNEKRAAGSAAGIISSAELREAEDALRLILARDFRAAWVAENVRDLLAEASAEYVEWLGTHPPAQSPVGWLITTARRRALDRIDYESRRPGSEPLAAELAGPDMPTPEDVVLERDRQRRLAEAIGHLEEEDRKLLALVYCEGHSVRGAGRLLGWGKSRANRHHEKAMERMLALVGDRDLLSPAILAIALHASVVVDRDRLATRLSNFASALTEDFGDWIDAALHNGTETVRRITPLGETGAAVGT